MENKKDIGNLNNKDFGVELDPTNNLKKVYFLVDKSFLVGCMIEFGKIQFIRIWY